MKAPGVRPARRRADDSGARRGWRTGLHLAVAVILAALAAVTPARPATAAPTGGRDAFGITPAPASDGRAAPYFIMAVGAGNSASGTANISNEGQITESLKVSRSSGITAANGGSAFNRSFQSCAGPGCWVTGLPRNVILPVGARERVPFTVQVPRGTAPGQYLAGITVELAGKPRRVQVGSNGSARAQALIVRQVTVGVAVTVGSLNELRTRLRIHGVSGAAIGPIARLSIRLDNTGQTFAHAVGRASCTVAGRRHSYAVTVATILPHEQAVIAVNTPGLPTGPAMPCQVRLRYGSGLIARWAGLVTIPAPPARRIIHVGPGVYAVIPSDSIPPWAIALFVVGALILATLAVLLFRMRKRRPAA